MGRGKEMGEKRPLGALMLFCHRYQVGEDFGIPYGQVCEDLPIYLYVGLLEAVDEGVIGEPFLARGGTDAQDPEPTEVALPLPTVSVGVGHGMDQGLLGPFVEPVSYA
jgi:hypothetical protein